MIAVELEMYELIGAVDTIAKRMIVSDAQRLNHASTYRRTFLERVEEELVGACGEIAFCKSLGRYWAPTVNTFHVTADVGTKTEIRSTRHDNGGLIVRDNDDPARCYVLVTGSPPRMTVRGWAWGHEVAQDRYRWNPGGHREAWRMPQTDLHPMPENR